MLFENILRVQKWPKKCLFTSLESKCVRYWPKNPIKKTIFCKIISLTPLASPNDANYENVALDLTGLQPKLPRNHPGLGTNQIF